MKVVHVNRKKLYEVLKLSCCTGITKDVREYETTSQGVFSTYIVPKVEINEYPYMLGMGSVVLQHGNRVYEYFDLSEWEQYKKEKCV